MKLQYICANRNHIIILSAPNDSLLFFSSSLSLRIHVNIIWSLCETHVSSHMILTWFSREKAAANRYVRTTWISRLFFYLGELVLMHIFLRGLLYFPLKLAVSSIEISREFEHNGRFPVRTCMVLFFNIVSVPFLFSFMEFVAPGIGVMDKEKLKIPFFKRVMKI